MGAWGTGIFDDDTSLDILYDFSEIDNPIEYMSKSFDYVIKSKYVYYDDCFSVLVSAALIDCVINCTDYEILLEEYSCLLETLKNQSLDFLRDNAIIALKIVISDKSEINELWKENDEEYPLWKQNIENLIKRLSI